jgi:uncharacterized protein YbjT (DUF2867 family)
MTILITGANGTIASSLLSLLAAGGGDVRALVRDAVKAPDLPGVEVAVGDLERPASLGEAFSGIDTLWLLYAIGPQAPHASSNAVWAARHAGVRHIVRLSAMGAAYDAPTRNGRLHALSDAELQASGIANTIIKPSVFMQNIFGLLNDRTLYHAWDDGRVSLIDTRDIAEFAARVLTEPAAHAGKTYTITGPQAVSISEVATTLTDVLGTSIGAQTVPADAAVAAMKEAGASEWVAEVIAREYSAALAAGWADHTTPDFEAVLDRPAHTIAEFARDYRTQLAADDNPAISQ